MDMDVVGNKERLLKGILDGETTTDIEPASREERLLKGILDGETTTDIEPASREERLLKAILENGGGGGGGDFSTATVTVQMEQGRGYTFYGAFLYQDELETFTYGAETLVQGELEELTIILYKNNGELGVDGNVTITVVEGNAEIIEERLIIHGDCTLSITDN